MEPVYTIGAGAIGKVLAVCLSNDGKKVVLLRGSVDNGESHKENIRVMLASQEIIEAEVTIDALSNYRGFEGLIVLCNKSYGNAALADASIISTLQDIRNHRPTEIATLDLAIAGMAATEQAISQILLLGQLTLLKSQL